MSKQLWVMVDKLDPNDMIIARLATQSEIDEAAGVVGLRKQRDALLEAAKLINLDEYNSLLNGAIFDAEFRYHTVLAAKLREAKDALTAAIANCERGVQG